MDSLYGALTTAGVPQQHHQVVLTSLVAGVAGLLLSRVLFGGSSPKKANYRPNQDDEVPRAFAKGEPRFVTEPDDVMPIRKGKVGVASAEPKTVIEVFKKAVARKGDSLAFRHEKRVAGSEEHNWREWTWKEYYEDCRIAAKAFIKLGIERFSTVSIIGFNSPEWIISDVAAIFAGAKAAGIYATNGPDMCQFICEHSQAAVVVVENNKQFAKFREIVNKKINGGLPRLKAIVVYDDTEYKFPKTIGNRKVKVFQWTEFMDIGRAENDTELDARMADQKAGQCCTLIYTSGTTGRPKAVMISHDNCTWTTAALCETIKDSMNPTFGSNRNADGSTGEHVVSYLPLSHIAAQVVDIHAPMYIAAEYKAHATVHFARPSALKGTLPQTLVAAKPTLFFGVPRVWEKIMEKMKAAGKNSKGLKKKLVTYARGLGLEFHTNSQIGGSGSKPLLYGLMEKLVFGTVRKRLGLTRLKMAITGAAPIAPATMNFFGALGLHIQEVYGMSENTGPQTVGMNNYFKVGSTGPPIKGVEIKIDHDKSRDKPGEGEICFRGRHVMMGYMFNEEKTKGAIDPDGWLHSGDVGELDDDNCLHITGRIKELIITAGGENIAPVPVEDAIKTNAPCVNNVVMIGDKKKYCTCLITLHLEKNEDDETFSDKITGPTLDVASAGVTTLAQAKKDKAILDQIQKSIVAYNETCVSRATKVQYFRILDTDFVPIGENAELTPTLKLKRPVVMRNYESEVEEMYTKGYDSMKQ